MAQDFFSAQQFRTLAALCDTLIPSIAVEDDPHGFWARSASDLGVPEAIAEISRDLTDEVDQRQVRLLFDLLANPLSAGLLTGHFRAFADLPVEQRERVLRRWAGSRLGLLRQSFQGLKRTAAALFYSMPDASGRNPNWPAIGYPGPPASVEARPKPLPVLPPATADQQLDCDVVVVGSGAGGGVAAAELAQAGLDVIVLEKGGYYDGADFDGDEYSGFRRLYENRGILTTRDLGVVLLAGATLGGGATVNWMTAFRTPQAVLEEWERDHHCTGIAGDEFQRSLDAVCVRLGVNTDESEPNAEARALERGCRALGYHCAPVPRNARGCGQPAQCGWCGFGCARGAKQSMLQTYLHDASQAGARLVVNADARRILLANGRAAGVEAALGDYTLTIRARAVVAAAGAIHSPALLRRSGLDNPNIGQHLHLHPTAAVSGTYPDRIETWGGVMQARYSDEFGDLDGRYHGFKIEQVPAHPGLIGLGWEWRSGRQHKQALTRAAENGVFIVLCRDRGFGKVEVSRAGRPILHYQLSPADAPNLRRGVREAFRLHAAAGAIEIGGPHSSHVPEPYHATEDVERYVDGLDRLELRPNSFMLFSAHQMSTCRMGGRRAQAVVDPQGESWDVPGLFVADASVFPSASGVNPMITIMALAQRVAQTVKARLR